ncbi:MAG: glycosyltransferase family 2 protein [Geminicoccaceae bacterium]
MKVAVVTPYYRPNIEWLRLGHQSVQKQLLSCRQIFVADGEPIDLIDEFDAEHIRFSSPNRDHGNTARAIGGIAAVRQGFDAICFLDSDHWLDPNHVQSLVELHSKTGADVCVASRRLHHLSGELLGACFETDGETPTDVNGFFLAKNAFPVLSIWHAMAPGLHPVGHLVVWHQIKRLGLETAHTGQATVRYRTRLGRHYDHFKIPWADGVKAKSEDPKAYALFERLRTKPDDDKTDDPFPMPPESEDGMLPRASQPDFLLISVIGMAPEARDPMLDWMVEDCAAKGKTPVFITEDLDLSPWIERQLLVEHLPSIEKQANLAPDLDWDLYLNRRLLQLKLKWRSANIADLGQQLHRISSLGPADPGSARDATVEPIEQQG